MILLSNQSKQTHPASKVIGIKPFEFHQEDLSEEEKVNELAHLDIQLSQAKEQLKLTNEQANQLLSDTRKTIETEKQKWTEEKQKWIEEAKVSGYQDGFKVGKEESLKEYQTLLDQAREIIELAEQESETILSLAEPTILRLGIVAASKIINHKLAESDAFIEITKNVLKEVQEQPAIRVISSPTDYQTLQKYKDELRLIIDEKADLTFYPDETLSIGSCIIETPFGKIDASIDSQLATLRQSLFDLSEEINRES